MNWTGLGRINEVDPHGDQDAALLADLQAVLERHGATDRFGVCLLHSHFDMAPDEVLVERVDTENRTLTTTVESDTSFDEGQLLPTMWRLDGNQIRAVQYCYRPRNSAFHMR